MSDCEQIAQVAHQNERIAHFFERIALFFERIAYSLTFWQKMSNSLRKQMSEFPALENTYPYGSAFV